MSSLVLLKNWSTISSSGEEYTSPQDFSVHFAGVAIGHPNYEDGTPIKTGRVASYGHGVFTTTRGTRYILSTPNQEYAKLYPNAYSQLVTMAEKYLTEKNE